MTTRNRYRQTVDPEYRHLDEKDQDAIAELLMTAKRQQRCLNVHAMITVATALCVVTLIWPFLALGPKEFVVLKFFVLAVVLVILSVFLTAQDSGAGTKPLYETVVSLTEFNDVRTVGVLIDALNMINANKVAELKTAILNLLNQISDADVGLLSHQQQGSLWFRFVSSTGHRTPAEEVYTTSVIKALTKIGNRSILHKIQRLANTTPFRESQRRVVAVARECLPAVELRLNQLDSPQTLLRASAPATSPDMLLRPASGTAQATPEETAQLLRPTLGQEEAAQTAPSALLLSDQDALEEAEQQLRLGSEPHE